MTDYTPLPGWFERIAANAKKHVAAMPSWQRDYMQAQIEELAKPDMCVSKNACDFAQTCVGGCVYR